MGDTDSPTDTPPDDEPDHFGKLMDDTEAAQDAYGQQLGLRATPFTAETLPHDSILVHANDDLLNEVASHILNRAGHVSIIDKRGAGKTLFRDTVYRSLRSGSRSNQFAIARIREVESITTRRFYVRLLDELQDSPAFENADVIPETYPHPTDEVRAIVEDVARYLEREDLTCIVQIDQLEDAAQSKSTFRQLLAGLQSVGDLGESQPVFLLFLFGTPDAGDRISEVRETLESRLIAEDRVLTRFGFAETSELIERWLAWARDEQWTEGYGAEPFTTSAIKKIVANTDGTPREVRQECYHAFRAGARQYEAEGGIAITDETIEAYR